MELRWVLVLPEKTLFVGERNVFLAIRPSHDVQKTKIAISAIPFKKPMARITDRSESLPEIQKNHRWVPYQWRSIAKYFKNTAIGPSTQGEILMKSQSFAWYPLTADRWEDLQTLFGPRGACGGCWCMTWRLSRKDFVEGKGAVNQSRFHELVLRGELGVGLASPPGVILYKDEDPVAWCAVAPREVYPALARSRVLAPLDDLPVWSVSCFFVRKDWRNKGVAVRVLKTAVEFASGQGAGIVEGFPTAPKSRQADPFVWTGVVRLFQQAGFQEAGKHSPSRPIYRWYANGKTKLQTKKKGTATDC